MFFLSHCCQSFLVLGITVHLYLPRMPSNTVLISGPAEGAAQILIWSLLCVLASSEHSYQSECIFFCGSSQWPFIYSIDTESA